MNQESKVWSPLWLEYSGLPQLLSQKVKGGAGWPLFKKLVELDCERNREPNTVEISIIELGDRCGIEAPSARKALLAMRKLRLIACFLPESDEEPALLKVRTPLETPVTPEQLKTQHPQMFSDVPQHFRYVDQFQAPAEDEAADPVLQEIVDLYFNAVGLKMNAFVLDELRLVRQRFPVELVRRTFRRAQKNEIRSLRWVLQELMRQMNKSGEENSNPEQ